MPLETTRTISTTVTANTTIAAGQHTPVDATAGAVTVTLPAGEAGSSLSVQKIDATAHTVTVSGNIAGTTGSTRVLSGHGEAVTFRQDGSGSWWPSENGIPAVGTVLAPPSGTAAGDIPTVQSDGTVAWAPPPAATPTPAATTTAEGVIQLAGDLAGTAATPALKTMPGLVPGIYGSSTMIPVITVDANGRITAISLAPAAGFYFYDPVNGWPAYPSTVPVVLWAVGYTNVPEPGNAADNSVWFYN